MSVEPTRRQFVCAAGLAGATALGAPPAPDTRPGPDGATRWRKAILDSLLPQAMPPADRFKLAVDCGFEGLEAVTPLDDQAVDAFRAAAERAGLRIHSVMNGEGNWAYPLSAEDDQIAAQGFALLCRSLRVAARLGADNVLVVPAQVTPKVSYQEAWARSQKMLRRTLPLADELGVSIGIENVGNRFLLSPLEFVRYLDELAHPRVRAYLDVGNCVMLWGYPQDWMATLGRRICKIHLKDCRFAEKKFVPLGEGDVDWPAVRGAMREIGYTGFLTVEPNYASAELKRGERTALCDLATRMDRVLGQA